MATSAIVGGNKYIVSATMGAWAEMAGAGATLLARIATSGTILLMAIMMEVKALEVDVR